MKTKRLILFSVVAVLFCSCFFGCAENGKKDNSIVKESIQNSLGEENSVDENSDAAESDSIVTEPVVGGTPVVFEDSELRSCVWSSLNLSSEEEITDKICETVTEIDCRGYILSTLSDLEMFPNLTELYVDNFDNELDLKGINKAPNLISVTLKNCRLSEVDRIADLKNLEYLDISIYEYSKEDDFGFGYINSILPYTYVTDYSSLASLTNLKYLDMSFNDCSRNVDVSFINSLVNLEELNIYGIQVEEYSLSELGKLKKLTLNGGQIDTILQELCNNGSISTLEDLSIGHSGGWISEDTPLSDDGMKNYLSKATNLKSLYICDYSLTTLEGLGNLKKLESLYINCAQFFSDLQFNDFSELSKLKNLTELTITFNPDDNDSDITPNDYSFLNDITNLKALSIDAYNGMAIDCFTGLKNLEKLTIGFDPLEHPEIDISGIEKFENLKDFFYYGTKFKSSAPLDDLDYLNVEEIKGYPPNYRNYIY